MLLRNLVEVQTELINVPGKSFTVVDRYTNYIAWVANSVRLLRMQVSEGDLSRLLLSRRYWTLQAMATSPTGMTGDLVDAELADRGAILEDTLRETREEFQRWSRVQRLVVADTTVYCQHPKKLEEMDLAALIECREEQIELVVPMAVVDELDNLKQSRDKHLRWRAMYTLAVFDRVAGTSGVGRLRESVDSALREDGIPRGELWIDVLFDLPGHVRFPIMDDEIVDRALAVQILSGKDVTFLTYDTGQAMRARKAGLARVNKLVQGPGPEPGAAS
jgi:rRNA-processing protein FCF1